MLRFLKDGSYTSGTGWGSSRKCFCILRENQAFVNSSTTEARRWKSFWKLIGISGRMLDNTYYFWKSLRTDLQSKPKFQFFLCYLVIVICSQLILYFRFVTWRCFIIIIIHFIIHSISLFRECKHVKMYSVKYDGLCYMKDTKWLFHQFAECNSSSLIQWDSGHTSWN